MAALAGMMMATSAQFSGLKQVMKKNTQASFSTFGASGAGDFAEGSLRVFGPGSTPDRGSRLNFLA
ncbi:MAG: hypothetical protein VKJ06_05185 [Vampirovibrionales bacterium]|nr:hypothetical protein [Vampirovibrionales bacterium]